MLARLGGLDGPRHMVLVGQRIVDGVDLGVGEQILIRSVGLGNAQCLSRVLRLDQITRGDGRDHGQLAFLHPRNHFLDADVGGAEHSPANLSRTNPARTNRHCHAPNDYGIPCTFAALVYASAQSPSLLGAIYQLTPGTSLRRPTSISAAQKSRLPALPT